MPFDLLAQVPFTLFDFLSRYDWEFTLSRVKVVSAVLSILFFVWWLISIWKGMKYIDSPQPAQPKTTPVLPAQPFTFTWPAIRSRLLSEDADFWRLAVIEADMLMNEVMQNRNVKPEQLQNEYLFQRANLATNKFKIDAIYLPAKQEVEEILGWYETVLKELGEVI